MAVFEKFAKGSIKHYNRFLPKIKEHSKFQPYKVMVSFYHRLSYILSMQKTAGKTIPEIRNFWQVAFFEKFQRG